MATTYDDPNRESVGLAPIWTGADEAEAEAEAEPDVDLDSMTKDELLDYAAEHDIDVPDGALKADVRAAIG